MLRTAELKALVDGLQAAAGVAGDAGQDALHGALIAAVLMLIDAAEEDGVALPEVDGLTFGVIDG